MRAGWIFKSDFLARCLDRALEPAVVLRRRLDTFSVEVAIQ
jgi:hypothetical protein